MVLSWNGTRWDLTYGPWGTLSTISNNGSLANITWDPVMGFCHSIGDVHFIYGQLGVVGFSIDQRNYYYQFDGLNVIGVTDSDGRLVNSYAYGPYGELLRHDTTVPNLLTFQGRLGVITLGDNVYLSPTGYAYDADTGTSLSNTTPIPGTAGAGPSSATTSWYVGAAVAERESASVGESFLPSQLGFGNPVSNGSTLASKPTIGDAGKGPTLVVQNALRCEYGGVGDWGGGGGMITAAGKGSTLVVQNALWCECRVVGGWGGGGGGGMVTAAGKVAAAHQKTNATQMNVGGSKTNVVRPVDPNEIIGPAGYGEPGFITAAPTLPYMIRFENKAEATAAAQQVVITQDLDPDLDWTTFAPGRFGFGNLTFDPEPGADSLHRRLDLRQTLGLIVDVDVDVDLTRGRLTWTFTSLDPGTGDLPAEPEAGFLPPNVTAPQGEGFVTYTVRAKAAAPTTTRLDALATIVFDVEPPLDTPAIFNTIDAAPPAIQVAALPPQSPNAAFTVNWAGGDDTGGSGVATYTVYVRRDAGAWEVWQQDLPATSAPLTPVGGTRYAFRAVATDNVGHAEPDAGAEEAWTQVLGSRWQNTRNACDVDNNGSIEPQDVLLTINELNAHGNHDLRGSATPPFLDPSGDGWIAPIDPLAVINHINSHGIGPVPTVAEGEGASRTETARDSAWPVGIDKAIGSLTASSTSETGASDGRPAVAGLHQGDGSFAGSATVRGLGRTGQRPQPRRWEVAELVLWELEDLLPDLTEHHE